MSIITGSLIGGAIRYAAGESDGWRPGPLAAAIAIVAIVSGRVGAFYVSPEMRSWFSEDLSPEEIQERIEQESSVDGAIAAIADEVEYDEAWLMQAEISDVDISEHWDQHEDDDSIERRYLPPVWEEAQRRWNALSDKERATHQVERRAGVMASYEVLDEELFIELIKSRTSDHGMIIRIAVEFSDDNSWKSSVGLNDAQITAHRQQAAEADPSGNSRHHAVVWQEATRRWTEMSEDARAEQRKLVEDDTRAEYELGEVFHEAVGFIRVLATVIPAIFSLIWPLYALLCTVPAAVDDVVVFSFAAILVTVHEPLSVRRQGNVAFGIWEYLR